MKTATSLNRDQDNRKPTVSTQIARQKLCDRKLSRLAAGFDIDPFVLANRPRPRGAA